MPTALFDDFIFLDFVWLQTMEEKRKEINDGKEMRNKISLVCLKMGREGEKKRE